MLYISLLFLVLLNWVGRDKWAYSYNGSFSLWGFLWICFHFERYTHIYILAKFLFYCLIHIFCIMMIFPSLLYISIIGKNLLNILYCRDNFGVNIFTLYIARIYYNAYISLKLLYSLRELNILSLQSSLFVSVLRSILFNVNLAKAGSIYLVCFFLFFLYTTFLKSLF